MKLRNPWLIRLAACITGVLLRVWLGTLRVRMRSADGRQHPPDPAVERFIYAFWHESLLAPAKMRTKAQIMISQSGDGEFIAQVCHRLGIGVVRGSSSRDGALGLLDMLRARRRTAFGVDSGWTAWSTAAGPGGSGTARVVHRLANRAGRCWVHACLAARSWDRFAVPWPFSTLVGVLGEPIQVARQVDRTGLEQAREQVEIAMLESTQAAESWARQLVATTGEENRPCDSAVTSRDAVPSC